MKEDPAYLPSAALSALAAAAASMEDDDRLLHHHEDDDDDETDSVVASGDDCDDDGDGGDPPSGGLISSNASTASSTSPAPPTNYALNIAGLLAPSTLTTARILLSSSSSSPTSSSSSFSSSSPSTLFDALADKYHLPGIQSNFPLTPLNLRLDNKRKCSRVARSTGSSTVMRRVRRDVTPFLNPSGEGGTRRMPRSLTNPSPGPKRELTDYVPEPWDRLTKIVYTNADGKDFMIRFPVAPADPATPHLLRRWCRAADLCLPAGVSQGNQGREFCNLTLKHTLWFSVVSPRRLKNGEGGYNVDEVGVQEWLDGWSPQRVRLMGDHYVNWIQSFLMDFLKQPVVVDNAVPVPPQLRPLLSGQADPLPLLRLRPVVRDVKFKKKVPVMTPTVTAQDAAEAFATLASVACAYPAPASVVDGPAPAAPLPSAVDAVSALPPVGDVAPANADAIPM